MGKSGWGVALWLVYAKQRGGVETMDPCLPARPMDTADLQTSTLSIPIREVEMTACVLSATDGNQLVGRSAQVRFW